MANLSIARRYARALLDIAAESGTLDETSEQLSAFAASLRDSAELSELLLNPAYSRDQRSMVVEQVIAASKMSAPVANLIRLLVERNRASLLPEVARLFVDMADQRAGRVRGTVTSAVKLSEDAVKKLAAQLEVLTQRKVTLDERVDPSLLGGVSAQVGSILYDGSLRTELENLRKSLRSR